jgi:hypothetical protein
MMKTAYRMAMLSSLAYWEFDRRKLPPAGSFSLQNDSSCGTLGLLKSSIIQLRVFLCHLLRMFAFPIRKIFALVMRSAKAKKHPTTSFSCSQRVRDRLETNGCYRLEWFFFNWHEPSVLKWHDTDLLIATSGDSVLALAFAGTASAADHFTNVQTFEPASHSGLFGNQTLGSVHRGFLNAYSRVERGDVMRLCRTEEEEMMMANDTRRATCRIELAKNLHRRYSHCSDEDNRRDIHVVKNAATKASDDDYKNSTDPSLRAKKKKRKGGCHTQGEGLMDVLRELITDALNAGHRVHLMGHSLGGGIATLLALDVLINFPNTPVSKLSVWTFGAPEVADDVFYQAASETAPRLHSFLQHRYHRFVALSDDCQADFVATVASAALPAHKSGLHGRAARHLGGVRGSSIVHPADPLYVPSTFTGLDSHKMPNYLRGISLAHSLLDHPLTSDLPMLLREELGEFNIENNNN